MDITMILNPMDTQSENGKASNHIEIRENAGDAKSKLPINKPLLCRNTVLADYYNQLVTFERKYQVRLERMKPLLPSIPLHCRNLNVHRSRYLRKTKSTQPHNNKPYTVEEADFIRYHKDDLGLKWEVVFTQFKKAFPNCSRESPKALQSRYYRDNKFKQYNENSTVMQDENGKIVYLSAKVRQSKTPEGKEEELPYGLVQRYPQRGLKYTWVGEEHKEQMRKLALQMDDDTRERTYSQKTQ